jgi:hypothetical protein
MILVVMVMMIVVTGIVVITIKLNIKAYTLSSSSTEMVACCNVVG